MIAIKDLVDKKGRELNVFCGEDGWIIKYGAMSHYVENNDGFDKNFKQVMEHINSFFGEVEEKEQIAG